MALHRHYQDHIPMCLQPILSGEIAAGAAEANVSPKPGSPLAFRLYVKGKDGQTEKGG